MSNPSSHISLALHEWGVDKERLLEKPEDLLFSLTSKLNEMGLEVGLATACIRTPHPQLDMLVFRWRPLTTEEVPTTSTTLHSWSTHHQTTGWRSRYLLYGAWSYQ